MHATLELMMKHDDDVMWLIDDRRIDHEDVIMLFNNRSLKELHDHIA